MLLMAGSFFLSASLYFVPLRSFVSAYLTEGISVTVFTYEEEAFARIVNSTSGLNIRKHISSEEGLEGFYSDTGVPPAVKISLPAAFNIGFDPSVRAGIPELIEFLENTDSAGDLVYSAELIENTLNLITRLSILIFAAAAVFAVSGLLFIYAGAHIYIRSRRSEFILSERLGYGRYIPALSALTRTSLFCFIISALSSGIISAGIFYAGGGTEIFLMTPLPPAVCAFTAGLFSLIHTPKERK